MDQNKSNADRVDELNYLLENKKISELSDLLSRTSPCFI